MEIVNKKKNAATAAARKERRRKQKKMNQAEHQKTNLMMSRSGAGGGIVSLIMMMVAFGSITTLISPLSLLHHCDASGEGEAPPALAPAASRSLRQKKHRSNIDNAESALPGIISPLPAVVPHPIFSPAAITASNRRMQSDESTSSACFDTPYWEDRDGDGCDYYEENDDCSSADWYAGDMGPATEHCCDCGGGSVTLRPTNSPIISNLASTSPTPNCLDNPDWKDRDDMGCRVYYQFDNCLKADDLAGDMGTASDHCCGCGGKGIRNVSQYVLRV